MADDFEDSEDWPSHGLTLAEARERIAPNEYRIWREKIEAARTMGSGPDWITDRVSLEEIRWEREQRDEAWRRVDELERKATERLLVALRGGKHFAYGRKGGLGSEPQLISADLWPALTEIDYRQSAAWERRAGGTAFYTIHIFDALQSKAEQSTGTRPKKIKKNVPQGLKARLVQEYVNGLDREKVDLTQHARIARQIFDSNRGIFKEEEFQALRKMVGRAVKERLHSI